MLGSKHENGHSGTGQEGFPPSVLLALAGLSMSALLASVGTSIANVALPSLALAFDVSFSDVQWIVLAYLLAVTASIVTAGRIGDVVGRRRVFLTGVGLFTAASVVCSVAPALWVLIAARAMQGIGAAAMMALSMAFVSEIVPKERTGRALGILGSMSAVGTALGPSLGGFLIVGFGWRSIFLINLPLGLIASILAYRHLPAGRSSQKIRIDFPGTLLLASALAALSLSMSMGRGSFGVTNAVLLLAAVVGFGLFTLVQARAASPLIKLAILRDPLLSASLIMSMLVTTVVMASLVVGPFYLSGALGLGTASVGLVMSCGPIVAALVGAPAGRAADRFGTYRMTNVGLIGMAVGASLLASSPASFGVVGYVVPLVIVTAGYALFQAANNTAVMAGSRPEDRGVISGMLNLSRNLGLITGASVMGAIFTASSAAVEGTPETIAAAMRVTFAVAATLVFAAMAMAVGGRALCRRAGLSACGERVVAAFQPAA
jgi:EmrB/QacA subfamily drug resistance transporter